MAKDLVGQKFNSLTVVEKYPDRTASKKVQWKCLCDCGKETLAITQHLLNGNTKSCGCRRVERTRELGKSRTTHGMTRSPEYKAWQSMKDRCYNEDNENYHHYGGRGIVVWGAWMTSFEKFYAALGPRPGPEYSLDRIDVNGNYRPDNCRWATAEEQANNKRDNIKYEVDGEWLTVNQLARKFDIPVATLASRLLRDNLTIDQALAKEASRHHFTHDGQTLPLNEWCSMLGLSYQTVYHRIFRHGWPFERAISPKDHRRVASSI